MRNLAFLFFVLVFLCGCANTQRGVKEDANKAVDWSKEKVNHGANWVEGKTRQIQNFLYIYYREMAERSKAAVLKTVEVKASWGSNPYLPATQNLKH